MAASHVVLRQRLWSGVGVLLFLLGLANVFVMTVADELDRRCGDAPAVVRVFADVTGEPSHVEGCRAEAVAQVEGGFLVALFGALVVGRRRVTSLCRRTAARLVRFTRAFLQ